MLNVHVQTSKLSSKAHHFSMGKSPFWTLQSGFPSGFPSGLTLFNHHFAWLINVDYG
jgi:hypothetical protein